MKKITQAQLNEVIKLHRMFLMGTSGGIRAVLKFHDLSDLDFSKANLANADLSGSILNGANLSLGDFNNTNFFSCDLYKTDMRGSNFTRADFRGTQILGANLSKADMKGVDFRQGFIMNYDTEDADSGWSRTGETLFSGSNIRDTNMSNIMAQRTNFTNANLQGVILNDANLEGSNFTGTNLTDTDLSGSNLAKVNMHNSVLQGTVVLGVTGDIPIIQEMKDKQESRKKIDRELANINTLIRLHTLWIDTAGKKGKQLNLSGYNLSKENDIRRYPLTLIVADNCQFIGLNLHGAMMQSSILDNSDFQDCSARDSDFRGSSFKSAKFTRADLRNANFSHLKVQKGGKNIFQPVDLSDADMSFTNMEMAHFEGANLKNTNFAHANLRNVDFTGAKLEGANFEKADLTGAILSDTIIEGKA